MAYLKNGFFNLGIVHRRALKQNGYVVTNYIFNMKLNFLIETNDFYRFQKIMKTVILVNYGLLLHFCRYLVKVIVACVCNGYLKESAYLEKDQKLIFIGRCR